MEHLYIQNKCSNMTVNQRVAGSSPAGGAQLDKPSEMMAFSFIINELG